MRSNLNANFLEFSYFFRFKRSCLRKLWSWNIPVGLEKIKNWVSYKDVKSKLSQSLASVISTPRAYHWCTSEHFYSKGCWQGIKIQVNWPGSSRPGCLLSNMGPWKNVLLVNQNLFFWFWFCLASELEKIVIRKIMYSVYFKKLTEAAKPFKLKGINGSSLEVFHVSKIIELM